MINDFQMIVHELAEDLEYVNLYPIGDVHIGSPDFDLEQWNKWKKMVSLDANGYILMVGDMLDNGLKHSKTDSYSATMRPREQKAWLTEELRPLADRILGACQGNHEARSAKESDDCPLYDVMAKLDLEDYYRESMAFIKINLGFKRSDRQWSYGVVLGHGASMNKVKQFSYAIDGMDVLVTGHTHDARSHFFNKIVMDTKNNVVRLVGYTHLVVPSFQKMGGYALKAMYLPQDHRKIPVLRLSGTKKEVSVLWL